MKSLFRVIQNNIQGKKVFGLFMLTNAVYLLMLGLTIPQTMSFSNGMNLLDMMPTGYDLNYVNELFSSLGEKGRQVYLTQQIPVDMVYPLLFGISYCLILGFFLEKLNKLQRPYVYACLLPLLAGFFDYLENISIINMLGQYPELTESMVNTSNTFTIAKSVLTSVYFVILLLVLIMWGIVYMKNSKFKV
ncbi:hypothetical protein [Lutimonas sp.]|uniref:hypothetical protein n=1 Tax=Lutimonas sp. TaxID=1872403 RepID=UPI003D9B4585